MQSVERPRAISRPVMAMIAAALAAVTGWTLLHDPAPIAATSDDGRVRVIPATGSGGAAEARIATGTGIALHGVWVGGTPAASSARLSANGREATFRIGDTVAPGVTLAAVEHDHVLLDEGGVQRPLYLLGSGATAARQGLDPEPVAPSGELDGATLEARIRAASGPVQKTPEEIAAGR